MMKPERPDPQRQRYWQGQTLLSRDFNDQIALQEHLQWWHNRALHNAYGIIDGLAVGSDGTGRLRVRIGSAYDGFGRILHLDEARTVLPPRESGNWTLVLQYRPHWQNRQRPHPPECSPTEVKAALVWVRGV